MKNILHVHDTVTNRVRCMNKYCRRVGDRKNRRKSYHQETVSYLKSDEELFKPSKMFMKII